MGETAPPKPCRVLRVLVPLYRFSVESEELPYKNIEDRRAANRRSYHRLIKRLHDLKGGRCAECGSETRYLEIHHTAEDGKNKKRQRSRYRWYRWLLTHLDEYELLCRRPCHVTRTMRYVRSFGRGGSRLKRGKDRQEKVRVLRERKDE